MYQPIANRLPSNVLRISVDTESPVPAQLLLGWAEDLVSFLEGTEEFPPNTLISVRHVGSGSSVAELAFLAAGAIGASLTAISAVGLLALAYGKSLEDGHPKTAAPLVAITNVYGGNALTITHGDSDPITIPILSIPGSQEIDWANDAGLPGVQVQKLTALETAEARMRPDQPALLVGRFLRKPDGELIFESSITETQVLSVAKDDEADDLVPLDAYVVVRGSISDNHILWIDTVEFIEPAPDI